MKVFFDFKLRTALEGTSASLGRSGNFDFVDLREKADLVCSCPDEFSIELDLPQEKSWKALELSFLSEEWRQRSRKTWNSKETLRQAMGLTKGEALNVVDATGGWMGDAFLMALWGCQVRVFEQNPLISFLMNFLWQQSHGQLAQHLGLDFEPSIAFHETAFVPKHLSSQRTDVLYIDPMYPQKKKSALNSKAMRLLKEIVGSAGVASDEELTELIGGSAPHVQRRIVLKRPQWAQPLGPLGGSWGGHLVEGKSTYFQVFTQGFRSTE